MKYSKLEKMIGVAVFILLVISCVTLSVMTLSYILDAYQQIDFMYNYVK